jgi:hypothetical protein
MPCADHLNVLVVTVTLSLHGGVMAPTPTFPRALPPWFLFSHKKDRGTRHQVLHHSIHLDLPDRVGIILFFRGHPSFQNAMMPKYTSAVSSCDQGALQRDAGEYECPMWAGFLREPLWGHLNEGEGFRAQRSATRGVFL